jgi:hypothetical protein
MEGCGLRILVFCISVVWGSSGLGGFYQTKTENGRHLTCPLMIKVSSQKNDVFLPMPIIFKAG